MALNLLNLPPEILLTHIFNHLSFPTLCYLSQVSKYLYNLIRNDNKLWLDLIKIEFSDQQRDMTHSVDVYSKFKELYLVRQRSPWTSVKHIALHGHEESIYYHYATWKSEKEKNYTKGTWKEITADEQKNIFSSWCCPLEKLCCANCKCEFTNEASILEPHNKSDPGYTAYIENYCKSCERYTLWHIYGY